MNRLEPGELKTYCVLLVFLITILMRFIGGF